MTTKRKGKVMDNLTADNLSEKQTKVIYCYACEKEIGRLSILVGNDEYCSLDCFKSKGLKMKLNEREKTILAGIQIGTEREMVENPFSKEVVELSPEAVAIYDVIKGAEMTEDYDLMNTGLDVFRTNWPAEYMILLD